MSKIFKGKLDDCERTGKRWIIRRAKCNSKYRDRKGKWLKVPNKPRIKQPDLDAFLHFAKGLDITIGFESDSNTFWLERDGDVSGPDEEYDGWDTGGQAMRLLFNLVFLSKKGTKLDTNEFIITTFNREKGMKGKASMLYVQLIMWLLDINEEYIFRGGDWENSDALKYSEHEPLFELIKKIYGRSFKITQFVDKDEEDNDRTCVKIVREPDVISETLEVIDINTHFVDQIIMGAVVLHNQSIKTPKLKITSPVTRNYHPGAMLMFAKSHHLEVSDSQPNSVPTDEKNWYATEPEEYKNWLETSEQRIISIN
jgi:hypothetical protein